MEYGLAFVVGTGMPRSSAYSISCSRVLSSHSRTGRQHLEVRVERGDAHLEADLVVALAGAAVRDVLRPVAMRLLDEVLHDDGPAHRREQRVLVLVERVGLQRLGEELLDVLLAHVLARSDSTAPMPSAFWRTNSRSWRSWPTSTRAR